MEKSSFRSAQLIFFHGCVTSARQMRVLVEASIPWRGIGISWNIHFGISCSSCSWDIHRIKLLYGALLWRQTLQISVHLYLTLRITDLIVWPSHITILKYSSLTKIRIWCLPQKLDQQSTSLLVTCFSILWRLLPVSSWQLILRLIQHQYNIPNKISILYPFFSHHG